MTVSTSRSRATARERAIRERFPFQVALPDDFCVRENFKTLENFSVERFGYRAETLRIRAVWAEGGDEDYRLYCFTSESDAAVFAEHFEGVRFDPEKDREDGRVRGCWHLPGGWSMPLRCGPLNIPRCWRENP